MDFIVSLIVNNFMDNSFQMKHEFLTTFSFI